MKILKKLAATMGLCLLIWSSPCPSYGESGQAILGKRALMIGSYHIGFPATAQQVDGVKSVLEPHGVPLDIEFMDTKRFGLGENLKRFRTDLAYKLSKLPKYDVIIVGDDAALGFALKEEFDLFADIPIVFCGVNDIDFALEQNGNPQVTGVIEAISIRGTIELIKRLQPNIKEIIAVADGQPSGQADLKKFMSNQDIFSGISFSVIPLDGLTWEESGQKLRELKGMDKAVLLLSAYSDRTGENRSFEDGLSSILDNLSVPCYHLWLHGLGNGMIGGRIISQYDQGRTAAQMAIRILEGTPAASIPVLIESPNKHVIDLNVMKRFSIPLSRAPEESEILNKPSLSLHGTLTPWLPIFMALSLGGLISLMVIVVYHRREKRIEKNRLEHYSRELEKLVQDRTSRLKKSKEEAMYLAVKAQEETRKAQKTLDRLARSEAMLIEAKETADQANRAKSDFLATMSHEIRTPLNAVIGLSRILMKDDLSERQRSQVSGINGSALSLLGIIDDILDFSKIEAGRMEIERIPFLLEEVLLEAVEAVSLEAEARDIEIHVDKSPTIPPTVTGDPLRLRQVMNNLLSNAVKFTEKGDIVISVKEITRDDENIEVELSVSDSGIGMTKEQLGRVFEPFMQADSSTTRRYRGTGLGLAISNRLCELMGGRLRARSVPGKGSSFTFSIPLGIRDRSETLRAKNSLFGLKVLTVDDNPIARKILGKVLASMGFEVETVSNGRDAIARLKSEEEEGHPFGLTIMDWKMPNMDGIETAGKILQAGLTNPPKMLMLTAHRKEEILDEAINAGFSSVLTKPVQPSSLLDAIVAVSEGKSPYDRRTEKTVSLDLKGATVLLAEDNDINRDVALQFLTDAHATVIEARDGKEAVDLASKSEFDLILMDIQMPRMDGFEATRTIRSMETLKRTPIIAMTAHAMKGDRERCIDAGMDDHIPKPVDPDILIATAHRWIFGRGEGETVLRLKGKNPEESQQFSGIDLTAGLRRASGDRGRYRSLLDKFIKEFFPLGKSAMEAIDAGNIQESSRLIHSLKGASATLGLLDVQRLSEDLEASIATGSRVPDLLWKELQELEPSIRELLSCMEDEECADAVEAQEITLEEAHKALLSIKEFLDLRQPRPILDLFESYSWPEGVSEDVDQLRDLVSRYRFKDAYSPLDSAIKKLDGEQG